jgi:cytochrome b561
MAQDPLESSQPLAAEPRYGSTAIVFHWAVAALVVVVGTLGLLHDDWPKTTQSYWINVHALLGLLLWGVVIARLAWRVRHAPPVLPDNVGSLARRLSSPVHFALYGLLLLIPVVGIITFIYHGRVFDFGLFRLDFGIKKNRAVFAPTEDFHGYLAYALFTLAALHATAALGHQFYLRDGVLLRMWPGRSGVAHHVDK